MCCTPPQIYILAPHRNDYRALFSEAVLDSYFDPLILTVHAYRFVC